MMEKDSKIKRGIRKGAKKATWSANRTRRTTRSSRSSLTYLVQSRIKLESGSKPTNDLVVVGLLGEVAEVLFRTREEREVESAD